MKFELHCHSWHSKGKKIPTEGIDSPADLVKAAKKLGLGGIALTDHSTNRGWKEAEQSSKKYSLIFIPAIEISSKEGHIIGLGLNEHILSGLSIEETIDKIHAQGGLAVAAHPFDIRKEGLKEKSAKADVIEVFNSMNLDMFSNHAALRFARKTHMPGIAGSDGHTKEMLGSCTNEIDAHDLDSSLREIRSGRVSFQTSYIPLEKLLPWVKRRFALSYPDVVRYIESNYWQPKRWISEQLVHKFMNDRNERFWYWIGETGLAGARGYGLARMLTAF
ncbi:MAG: CehA/McbA family metallohydrolase [Candidatus Aenigmarchaeota archaeon]|nr:CehA/McbA family metallohydrolase [Candidatus Aenigmarchaeota archaeon]